MHRSWVLLVVCALLAGCVGVTDEPSTGGRAPTPAVPLAASVALVPGELVARDDTSALFSWRGDIGPGPRHLVDGAAVGQRLYHSANVHLPEDAAILVEVELHWDAAADLNLFVWDGDRLQCSSSRAASDEACYAWVDPGAARDWRVEVEMRYGPDEAVAFEVRVRVTSIVHMPRYDIAIGPEARVQAPDPAAKGPHQSTTADYDFGVIHVQDRVTLRPYPVRVLGTAHFPGDGAGPFPAVVMLHGRTSSCQGPGSGAVASHCRGTEPVMSAVQSHRGYDEVAKLLVSHGYVVFSIDANDVNALDSPSYASLPLAGRVPASGDDGLEARAKLIMATLDGMRDTHMRGGSPTNPQLDALTGRIDLGRIGLMGHSRGAEGVTHAPGHAQQMGHWSSGAYVAVYSLAGTTRPYLPDHVVPVVHAPTAYLAVSPYCDGDIWTLGNVDFFDLYKDDARRGPLTHLLFMGANHNYYNSEWKSDDAAYAWRGDPYCGPGFEDGAGGYGRLSPEDQRRQQQAYLPAFFRLHLGGEEAFAPLFTGEAAPPQSACPSGVERCPRLVHVSVQPLPDAMRSIEDATTREALVRNDLGGSSMFTGFASARWCDPRTTDDGPCAWPRAVGNAPRLRVAWQEEAAWRTEVPADLRDAQAFDTLAFRVGVDFEEGAPHGGVDPRLRVVLEDERGRRAEVDAEAYSGAVFAPPGDSARRVVLNQVRIPLDAFGGVDLARVVAVELRFGGGTSSGAAHLASLALLDLSRAG